MKIEIENKTYETGKFSPSLLKKVVEVQDVLSKTGETVEQTVSAIDALIDFVCLLFISGTEKIPYRNIKQKDIDELKPIFEDNYDFSELLNLFTEIMTEIMGSMPNGEGKQIVA